MKENLEAMGSLFLILFALGFVISCLFIWLVVKFVPIKNVSLKKIIFSALLNSCIVYILLTFFSASPSLDALVGFALGIFFSFMGTKIVLRTTVKQTLLIWIFNTIAHIAAIVIGASLFIGGISYLIDII